MTHISCPTPFREPLQFIVITVMSVICLYLKGSSVTINSWHVGGSSCHRHRGKGLPERLPRSRDGHDAHDGPLLAYSRQRVYLYSLGAYPFHPNPTNPTRRAMSPYLCGFSTYDWCRVCLISMISRRRYPTKRMVRRRVGSEHCRVLDTQPDDNKPLTYAGYHRYRRVCRVV